MSSKYRSQDGNAEGQMTVDFEKMTEMVVEERRKNTRLSVSQTWANFLIRGTQLS